MSLRSFETLRVNGGRKLLARILVSKYRRQIGVYQDPVAYFAGGRVMPSYDVRLWKRRDGAKPVYRIMKASDFAAICDARKAAENGDRVEVWCGMECIYAAQEHGAFSLAAPPNEYPTAMQANA